MRWDDSSEGSGPSGVAIRTGRPCVIQSVPDSQHFGPWRETALAHGFLSMGAFPLKDEDGNVTGVLHVYGDRTEAFGEEEIGRLEMFAQQCSIAVMSAGRLKNLRDAHRRILFHVTVMPLAYIVWDRDFHATEWKPAAERIFGWKAEEALGRHTYEVAVPPEAQAHVNRVWANLLAGRWPDYSLNTNAKVYLPPVDAPPDEVTPLGPSGTPGGTETILLAEDDGSVRMLVERTLSDLGYTVLSVRDGVEAVETFRRNGDRVDPAILDVVMPRLGGKEAYEELHKERPDLKVIFMSGYTADAVHESFVLIAGIPFLAKPLGPGALARKVREVLDGR